VGAASSLSRLFLQKFNAATPAGGLVFFFGASFIASSSSPVSSLHTPAPLTKFQRSTQRLKGTPLFSLGNG